MVLWHCYTQMETLKWMVMLQPLVRVKRALWSQVKIIQISSPMAMLGHTRHPLHCRTEKRQHQSVAVALSRPSWGMKNLSPSLKSTWIWRGRKGTDLTVQLRWEDYCWILVINDCPNIETISWSYNAGSSEIKV